MEKIKQIISGGKSEEETSTSRDTSGTTGNLTGEGSHFSNQPTASTGTGGGVLGTGTDGSTGYGAQPGVGISSFTQDATKPTTATEGGYSTTGVTEGTNTHGLADRSLTSDKADVAGTYTDRTFPLGGTTHTTADTGATGTGSHTLFTTERLDPHDSTHERTVPYHEPHKHGLETSAGTAAAPLTTSAASGTTTGRDLASHETTTATGLTSGTTGATGLTSGTTGTTGLTSGTTGTTGLAGGTTTDETLRSTEHERASHLGRDTAVIGGAGAAGAGAYEYEKHKHDTDTGHASDTKHDHSKREHKHDSDAKQERGEKEHKGSGMFGFLHKDEQKHPKYEDQRERQHSTAKEKYFGQDPAYQERRASQDVDPEKHEHHYGRDAAVAGGAGAAGAGAYAAHEHSKETTEDEHKKKGGLSSLLHRDNPNKLHKEPPASEVKPPAHDTFVKPGYNHEQHMGVDGQIGKPTEVSGVQGSDARRTSNVHDIPPSVEHSAVEPPRKPSLAEKQAEAPPGTVIEAYTGLPMNVEKYGTGAGGTDGSKLIHGFDQTENKERQQARDEEAVRESELNWDKIKAADTVL